MTPQKSYDNKFFFTNVFHCCFWIRDPGWVQIGIRDKHPGSATLPVGKGKTFSSVPVHVPEKSKYAVRPMHIEFALEKIVWISMGQEFSP